MQSEAEQFGLVETPLSFSRRMQRNRHDEIESAARQPWIIHRLGEPATEQMTEMNLPAVFEIMHDFSNDAATAISRNRRVEMQDAILAVRTSERLSDGTGERLGTFRAERRQNPSRRFRTPRAKRFAWIDRVATRGTVRRIKQTNESAKRVAGCARDHVSTSCA